MLISHSSFKQFAGIETVVLLIPEWIFGCVCVHNRNSFNAQTNRIFHIFKNCFAHMKIVVTLWGNTMNSFPVVFRIIYNLITCRHQPEFVDKHNFFISRIAIDVFRNKYKIFKRNHRISP